MTVKIGENNYSSNLDIMHSDEFLYPSYSLEIVIWVLGKRL